jgi:hypothetical protein
MCELIDQAFSHRFEALLKVFPAMQFCIVFGTMNPKCKGSISQEMLCAMDVLAFPY